MKVEIQIDEACTEPRIEIHACRVTPQIAALARQLSGAGQRILTAFRDGEVFLIRPEDIISIYTEGQKVLARLETGTYRLKSRLYELEEQFEGTPLLRISHSEIVNFDRVESLDLSVGGTITLKLKPGGRSFVSRRYVDRIKKYLNL